MGDQTLLHAVASQAAPAMYFKEIVAAMQRRRCLRTEHFYRLLIAARPRAQEEIERVLVPEGMSQAPVERIITQKNLWAFGEQDGLCMVADIVGFSRYSRSRVQRQALQALYLRMSTLSLMLRLVEEKHFVIQSVGDGFQLVLLRNVCEDLHTEALEAAQELIERCLEVKLDGRPLRLRLALHRVQVFLGREGRPTTVGLGFGYCRRIATVAPPGHAVVTEEFFKAYLDDAVEPSSTFFPKVGAPPWEIVLKFGQPSKIRIWSRGSEQAPLPPKVALQERVTRNLRQEMLDIGEVLKQMLEEQKQPLTDAGLRLTWWVPGAEFQTMFPRIRVYVDEASGDTESERRLPSQTRYQLGTFAEGPVGRCFEHQERQMMLSLPEDPAAYIQEWEAVGVRPAVVAGFSRRSRSVVALPIFFNDDSRESGAVLCIDAMVPLSAYRYLIETFSTNIIELSGPYLSTLWQLRMT